MTKYEEIRQLLCISDEVGEESSYTGYDNITRPSIVFGKRAYYIDDEGMINYEVSA